MVTKVGVPLNEAVEMATDTPLFVHRSDQKRPIQNRAAMQMVVICRELEVSEHLSRRRHFQKLNGGFTDLDL